MSALARFYTAYRQAPDHPMKGRILSQIDRFLPSEGIPYRTPGDIWMRLHPSKSWDRHFLSGGSYQVALCEFMHRNLHEGDVATVAGVSFGQQTIVASNAVGRSGVVVGCDPHPAALIKTRDNLTLNNLFDNVKLVPAALGKERGSAPIEGEIKQHVGEGSLIKAVGRFPYYARVESLTDILADLGLNRLDALFLDVIGYEMPILAALREPYLPRLMTIVVHPWVSKQTGDDVQAFQARVGEMGYSIHSLDGRIPIKIEDLLECQLVCLRNGSANFLDYNPHAVRGVWL